MDTFIQIVDRFISSPSEQNAHKIVKHALKNHLKDQDITYLTKCLAESGEGIDFSLYGLVADIASTGGPSSLSTLLCPLYLRCYKFLVPKLGIPGRPAGGIDVLAQIPGYKINYELNELKKLVLKDGYIHFLSSNTFVPLDAVLFYYRKKADAIAVPSLAIASLLSKKIALGVKLIGLDVRVAIHGNFGVNWASAKANTERFCRIAKSLECKAIGFLSDGNEPYQPYIGRGESLVALSKIFEENNNLRVKNHVKTCSLFSSTLAAENIDVKKKKNISTEEIKKYFKLNLESQGAKYSSFLEYTDRINKAHKYHLRASREGFFSINLKTMREIIVKNQISASSKTENHFPDTIGVILKKNPGEYTKNGDLIASVRIEHRDNKEILSVISETFRFLEQYEHKSTIEVIKHE